MIKEIALIILLQISFIGYSQVLQLKELKSKQHSYELEIERLKEELTLVNKEIEFIENQQTENASQEWITVKAYAELYERATIMSTTIARFTTETKVLLLDIEEEYMYVKSQFGNGYVKLYYLKSEKSNLKTITSSSLSPKTKSTSNSSSSNSQSSYNRKTYNTSRTYYKGPRGGCYYFNSNGNKTYVSRSQCS